MDRVLVALYTCDQPAYQYRQKWCLDRWGKDLPKNYDLKVCTGKALGVPDGLEYPELGKTGCQKARAIARYASNRGYDWVLKVDDDTDMRPNQLRIPEGHDYAGWVTPDGWCAEVPWGYCQGGGYWLSRKAMQAVAEAPVGKYTAEDLWVAKVLRDQGILPHHLEDYPINPRLPLSKWWRTFTSFNQNWTLLLQVNNSPNGIMQSLWWPRLGVMERLSVLSYLHFGKDFHLYSYGPCENVPQGAIVFDASEIMPESEVKRFKHLANFADWFRYHLLLKKGGWWVDLDSVCLRPFDFPEEHVFAEEMNHTHFYCNNAFIKAPVGSYVMKFLIEECKRLDPDKIKWTEYACDPLTAAVEKFKLKAYPPHIFNPTWPEKWNEVISEVPPRLPQDSYAIHLWRQSWKWANQDRDANYPPTSYYERLKRRYGVSGKSDVVQSLWVGPSLSVMEQLSIRSFMEHGHPFHLYVYAPCANVPEGTVLRNANEIMPESSIGEYGCLSNFSDVFRYKLLSARPTWWVDLDVVCLKTFDFPEEYVFGCEQFPPNTGPFMVNACVMKVPADSEFLIRVLEKCSSYGEFEHKNDVMSFGPHLVTELVEKMKLWKYVQPVTVFNPIPGQLLPQRALESGFSEDLSHSYAVHLFQNTWEGRWARGEQNAKHKEHDPTCLYEQLKRRYLGVSASEVVAPQPTAIPKKIVEAKPVRGWHSGPPAPVCTPICE